MKAEKGFTIVELLIVIVVIGILAAIIVVAYNGVQNNARRTSAQATAKEVADKAEVYAAENNGTYPTLAQLEAATGTAALSGGTGAKVDTAAATANVPVQYTYCSSNGAIVTYHTYGIGSADARNLGNTTTCP